MKITIDIADLGYTDPETVAEHFEEFYEQVRMARQMKNGRPVDRKVVREAWKKHLIHVALYFVTEEWDMGLDETVERLVRDMDREQDQRLYRMVKDHQPT